MARTKKTQEPVAAEPEQPVEPAAGIQHGVLEIALRVKIRRPVEQPLPGPLMIQLLPQRERQRLGVGGRQHRDRLQPVDRCVRPVHPDPGGERDPGDRAGDAVS